MTTYILIECENKTAAKGLAHLIENILNDYATINITRSNEDSIQLAMDIIAEGRADLIVLQKVEDEE